MDVTVRIGNGFRLIEQCVCGDGVSSSVYLKQKYRVPITMKKDKIVRLVNKMAKNLSFDGDGVICRCFYSGWSDPSCRTIEVSFFLVSGIGVAYK